MKNYLMIIFTIFIVAASNSQINGITDTGDEILLFDNGTWKYKNDTLNIENEKIELLVNEEVFKKDENSNFLSKSEITNVGVWLDPKKWTFTKGDANGATELKYKKKTADLYAMLITEKMEAPLETLADIAFQNAKEAAPDVKVVKKEYRVVNGNKVIMMQMKGTIQGIKFIYFSYYYTSENGAVQLVSYTSQNLFEEYKEEMEKFLNGLVQL